MGGAGRFRAGSESALAVLVAVVAVVVDMEFIFVGNDHPNWRLPDPALSLPPLRFAHCPLPITRCAPSRANL